MCNLVASGDATKPGDLRTQYDGPRPDPKIAGTCGKSGTYQVPYNIWVAVPVLL
jgi:hypothetical protein